MLNKMDLMIDKWESDSYMLSVQKLKNLINKLPDDGEVRIAVEKHYDDGRVRGSLEKIDGFKMQGKVLVIGCSTIVY